MVFAEEEICLAVVPPLLRQFATLAIDTGLGPAEILCLNAIQVGKEHVRYDTLNSQYDRTIERLRSDAKLGVPFCLYDLRHSFLTWLGEAGADAFTIQMMAWHSIILVSQRYVHPTPERVEEEISCLEQYNRKKTEELTANMRVQELGGHRIVHKPAMGQTGKSWQVFE